MKRDADCERSASNLNVQRVKSGEGVLRGGQRPPTRFFWLLVLDGKDGEHRVPDELEDLAAAILDGRCDALEIGIEKRDDFFYGSLVHERGEAPKVACPDDRIDETARPPLERSVQHPRCRVRAQVDVQELPSGAVGRGELHT